MAGRTRRFIVVGCFWAALSGCGGTHDLGVTSGAGAAASASVTQTREDQAAGGRLQITITNTGPRPFTVTAVQLRSPGFAVLAPSPREEPFPPGITYDMPAPYGAVQCGQAAQPATADVTLQEDGGPSRTLQVRLNSPDGLLDRIHRTECDQAQLLHQVGASILDLHPDAGQLSGTLRVSRATSLDLIMVAELRDSVLYDLAAQLPAQLDPGVDHLDVPLTVRPATCSGHVIAETKQPYLFAVFVSIGSHSPVFLPLTTDDQQRDQLQALTRTSCLTSPP